MARDTLTGSRIRERRIMAGMKQAELARAAKISASYLNLIEHNRRRIGGKLLLDLAAILEVEPAALTEGAEATLIAALREAASGAGRPEVEIDRVDEFAGRFPGWAALLADTHRRTGALERTVETLTDRLTHDPHLAAALHEMLSTVTAIRATAAILAEPGEITPDWQRRFHRNIHEDSNRLAETSRTLVSYLDGAEDASSGASAPQEEVDAILARAGHRFPAIESGAVDPATLAETLGAGVSGTARRLLARLLRRYAADARQLPLAAMHAALAETGPDPFRVASALHADPAQVMRRLAVLPEELLPEPPGLAVCDASGALTYRKPLVDFPMPRFGAGCPLWPLYHALTRPMTATRTVLAQPGATGRLFRADSVAVAPGPILPDRPALFEAHMLIVPLGPGEDREAALPVGVSCRICPRTGCAGRREPSILPDAGREEF